MVDFYRKEPGTLITNWLINLSDAEKFSVYKIIFSCQSLFHFFQSQYETFDRYISSLSAQLPLHPKLVNVLLDPINAGILMSASGKELIMLSNSSLGFFKGLILSHPTLFIEMQKASALYIILEKIHQLKNERSPQTSQAEWDKILSHHYHESIDSSIQSMNEKPPSMQIPVYTPGLFNPMTAVTIINEPDRLSAEESLSSSDDEGESYEL